MTCLLRHTWETISALEPKCVQECKDCGQVRVLHFRIKKTEKDTYKNRATFEKVRPREVIYVG